jgi:hypothetical protein
LVDGSNPSGPTTNFLETGSSRSLGAARTPDGFYELRKHTLVTFAFRGIEELELKSFNHQNVLFDLGLQDISDRHLEVLKWAVNFASSFGVEASFLCNEIAVLRVAPFDPPAALARPAQLSARPLPDSAD